MTKFQKKKIYEPLILGENPPIHYFLILVYDNGVSVTHGVTYYKFFFRVPTDSIWASTDPML